MWGLAFKPETDDMREAPSLVLIDKLLASGCEVYVYDPVSMEETCRRLGDALHYAKDIYDAVVDADALLLVINIFDQLAAERLLPQQIIVENSPFHRLLFRNAGMETVDGQLRHYCLKIFSSRVCAAVLCLIDFFMRLS